MCDIFIDFSKIKPFLCKKVYVRYVLLKEFQLHTINGTIDSV